MGPPTLGITGPETESALHQGQDLMRRESEQFYLSDAQYIPHNDSVSECQSNNLQRGLGSPCCQIGHQCS